MTTSKLYEFRAELECALGLLEKNADNYYSALSLSRLIEKVDAEITAADAKSTGRTSTLVAVKRILKNSASSSVEGLKYATVTNGYQYFSDGFRFVALDQPLPGFPAIPENVGAVEFAKLDTPTDSPAPLQLPDLNELKNWIKRKTAEHKASGQKTKLTLNYQFGDCLPVVNAAYLVDMMEALPGAVAAVDHDKRNPKAIRIWFTAENGHGLLMPVFCRQNPAEKTNLAA